MLQPSGGYKPVQYSQEVLDLHKRVEEAQAELDEVPQEALHLSQVIETSHRGEVKSHLLAGAAGALAVAGLVAVAATPVGWILAAVGAVGVVGAEFKAVQHREANQEAQSEKEFLPIHKSHLEEHRDFLAQWESDRRHTEWHEVNGY